MFHTLLVVPLFPIITFISLLLSRWYRFEELFSRDAERDWRNETSCRNAGIPSKPVLPPVVLKKSEREPPEMVYGWFMGLSGPNLTTGSVRFKTVLYSTRITTVDSCCLRSVVDSDPLLVTSGWRSHKILNPSVPNESSTSRSNTFSHTKDEILAFSPIKNDRDGHFFREPRTFRYARLRLACCAQFRCDSCVSNTNPNRMSTNAMRLSWSMN